MDFKEAAKAIAAQISRAISFGQDPEPIVARHLEKFYQIGIEDGKKSSDINRTEVSDDKRRTDNKVYRKAW